MRRRRFKSNIRNDFTKPLWRRALDKAWNCYLKFYRPIAIVLTIMLIFLIFHFGGSSHNIYIALICLNFLNVYLFVILYTKFTYRKQMEFFLYVFILIYYYIYWDGIKVVIGLLGHKFLGL